MFKCIEIVQRALLEGRKKEIKKNRILVKLCLLRLLLTNLLDSFDSFIPNE
jgi:hypothetical protein